MICRLGIVIVSVLCCAKIMAATATFTAGVTQVLIDDQNYAGCMARLTENVGNQLAGCNGLFVTLDCTGELGSSKSIASAKLGAVQLAMVTDTVVRVTVDNTRLANNYCIARRIDNTQTPVP